MHHSNLRGGDCSPNNRRHCCNDGRHQSNAGQHHSNDMLHHSNHRQHCSPPNGGCHCSNDGQQSSFTVGGRIPMLGDRIGTGNPAGGTVNAVAWDWIDGAPLRHLRRESTTAGVLLDTDGSMKWRRRKKWAQQSFKFTIYSSRCQTFLTMSRVSWWPYSLF